MILNSDNSDESAVNIRKDERAKRRERTEKCKTITLAMIKSICVLILALMMLAVLTAPDIAMYIINLQNQCTLGTEDGMRQYVNFGLSAWMYWASITHFSVVSFSLISAALGALFLYLFERHFENDPYVDMVSGCISMCWGGITFCIFVMVHVFLLAWTVIGFLLDFFVPSVLSGQDQSFQK